MATFPRKPIHALAAAIALMLAGTGSAVAADWNTLTQEAKDAYRHGQIWATYATSPVLEAREIDVDVEGGTVTLNGTVETIGEKALAGAIALGAEDVTSVINNLRVDPELIVVTTITPMRTYAQLVADSELAANIDSMLLWNEYTDGLDINVSARGDVVTLTGVADTEGSKQRAAAIALGTRGVRTVINNLRVDDNSANNPTAKVTDGWIKEKLADTYLFSTLVNSAMVDIGVKEGEVSLSGTVTNTFQRESAIQLAQDTRGVKRVDASKLVVAGQSG